jgi:hypothetical protein
MKKLAVMVCLALGLSACGVEAPEETTEESRTVEQLYYPPGPTTCDMDGCPSGMCATGTYRNTSCSGGVGFTCSTIIVGTTKCI